MVLSLRNAEIHLIHELLENMVDQLYQLLLEASEDFFCGPTWWLRQISGAGKDPLMHVF